MTTNTPTWQRRFAAGLWNRTRTFIASNSSVLVAFIVIGGLFLGQRYAADWLTGNRIVDESDIVPASSDPSLIISAETCDPWILTFSDEFEDLEVDDNLWMRFDSPGRNDIGVRRPDAIEIRDGVLVITSQLSDDEIVTGGMASQFQQLYGRFEARVRTGVDTNGITSGVIGTWPAGNDHPDGGQNDFYDTLSNPGREPFYSYFHRPDGTQEEIIHNADTEDWHEIAMEWSEGTITMFRDDELIGRITDQEAIPNVPHVVTIQMLATETGTNDTPVMMFVDWLRVYQRNDSPPASC